MYYSLSLEEFRKLTFKHLKPLEETGLIKSGGHYEEIFQEIENVSIFSHRKVHLIFFQDSKEDMKRGDQREKEVKRYESTLGHLLEKEKYLNQQIVSYNDYVSSLCANLASHQR